MEAFVELFGNIRLGTVVLFIVALVFLYRVYCQVSEHLVEKYKQEEEKERKIEAVIEQAAQYPKWHEHSLAIQKKFSTTIDSIEKTQNENLASLNRLNKMVAENEATTCRYRILRFNDEILHEEKHSKEHFDQVLEDISRYERFCNTHPEYENNKAVLAIKNIKRVYQTCSENNSFL